MLAASVQRFSRFLLCAAVLAASFRLAAQDAAKPTTFLGTVQSLSGNNITVKNDAGSTMQVTVQDNARLLRIEPGQKTLAGASPFSLSDLATGDRVMARGSANADNTSLAATMLVAIKGADIAQKQEKEREDWQKHGTGGLVKAVDPAAGTVTISSGDGATLEAEEIVSGSFRNLAGPIQAVNAAASTITVNDTATKKPVVISVTPDSEVKKLDPAVAQRLAARMNGGGARRPDGSAAPAAGGPPSGAPSGPPPGASGADRPAGGQGRGSGFDVQQLLARSPSVALK